VREGRVIVVDIDLEKCSDRPDHDVLMLRLARRVTDKWLLRITRHLAVLGTEDDAASSVCGVARKDAAGWTVASLG